jgi:tetratricopeptide (TPR) repeat protein
MTRLLRPASALWPAMAIASIAMIALTSLGAGADPAPSGMPSAASSAAASTVLPSASLAHEPIFDGLGHVHHPVTTESTLAQRYFDQGLTFVYAFNHDEAAGSFKEAARRDPNMAMAYWGVALALGPNINLPEDPERGKEAYAAIQKAESLAAKCSPAERAYIDALAKRYAADGIENEALQKAYADAMRTVAHQYPDDPDAGALFAESMMDLHPWNLWTADGKPVEGTDEIVKTLEDVMAKYPDHVGANHYYIHAVEASPNPGRALPSADRLGALVPAAGHLVHMPSHIYIRTGEYEKSADANASAIKVDRIYIRERSPKGIYPLMYYPHNIQFLWASYMMEGNSKGAFKASHDLDAVAYSPEAIAMVRAMPMGEFLMTSRYFTEARFGNWNRILKEKAPAPDFTYITGIWHYARGLAFAAKGKIDQAGAEQKELDKIAAAMPDDRIVGFNSGKKLLQLGSATLAGEIAAAQGKHDEAIPHLRDAVAIQDALNYEEPPAWYYPVRETLGMELLADGKIPDAEQIFRDDLTRNPENGWSLNGLALCLHARNAAPDEVGSVEDRFKKAWAHADVKPPIPAAAPEKTAASH